MSLLSTLSALTQSVHAYERQLRQAIGLPDAPQPPQSALDACARLEAAAREGEAAVRGRLGAPAEAPAVRQVEAALARQYLTEQPQAPAAAGRLGVPGRPVPNGAGHGTLLSAPRPEMAAVAEKLGAVADALEKGTATDGELATAVDAAYDSLPEDFRARAEELSPEVNDAPPPAPAIGARKAKGKRR
jgi:hypothetical protein